MEVRCERTANFIGTRIRWIPVSSWRTVFGFTPWMPRVTISVRYIPLALFRDRVDTILGLEVGWKAGELEKRGTEKLEMPVCIDVLLVIR